MNVTKKLWLKVKNTETLQLLMNTILNEYLEKDLIESFGIFDESSLEDYDFLNDKCVFITFDEKFDYLSFCEAVSTIFDTPLLCYIAGTYFYYDENHIYSNDKNPFDLVNKNENSSNLVNDFNDGEKNVGCLPDNSFCNDDCFCAKSDEKQTEDFFQNETITSIEVKEFNPVELGEVGFGKIEFLFDESESELKPKGVSPEELEEIFKKASPNQDNSKNLDVFNFFEETKENEEINDVFKFKVTDEPDLNLFDESFDFESEADANSCCGEQSCENCEGCSWDFSEDFDYNDILNSIEDEKEMDAHHLECVCEDTTQGEIEMSNDKNKDKSFIDNEALTEFESISTDSDNTNKIDSVENIFKDDSNLNSSDLDALINENEYEQIFSELSNLSSEDNFDADTNSIQDKDLITAEELEKILSSNDEFDKSLFVDKNEEKESDSLDDDYVSDEPFNFEEFFNEITKNQSEENEIDQNFNFSDNETINSEINLDVDELLKFSDDDNNNKFEFNELEEKNLDLNDVESSNDDLFSLNEHNWNSNETNSLKSDEKVVYSNAQIDESLNSLNELDWNNKEPSNPIIENLSIEQSLPVETINKDGFESENWSEFVSINESNLTKNNNLEVANNFELTKEVEEFFENENEPSYDVDFAVNDSEGFEKEFILPAEIKEENSFTENMIIDNKIDDEKSDLNDFFVNFEPSIENINHEEEKDENIIVENITNNIEEHKFEPDISDNKIIIDKQITNDLQKFLAELKLEKEKLKKRKQNLERRTSKVKSMFRDINNSNGYTH